MKTWLKKNFSIIKANFILLVGVGLFTYNIFAFKNDFRCKGEWIEGVLPKLPSLGGYECDHAASFYYYTDTSLILLAIAAILIMIGLLKRNKQ